MHRTTKTIVTKKSIKAKHVEADKLNKGLNIVHKN